MSENDKKVLIYNSGVKLFSKMGPKKVSIDMIVNEAGVGKGTFYNYFENKEQLYEQIINNIIYEGSNIMKNLYEKIPEIKERFLCHMIGMLSFFENNIIIKKLKDGNTDFYFGNITKDFLYEKHIGLIKILIGPEFKNDDEFVNMISNVKGFFTEILNKQKHFNSIDEYNDFTLKLAAIMINGIFSDYESVIKGRKISDFTCKNNIN